MGVYRGGKVLFITSAYTVRVNGEAIAESSGTVEMTTSSKYADVSQDNN